jgi:hypothetical protein
MVYDGLAIGIILICVAFLRGEGLWGNLLTLFNLIFAGLVAMNFFEPMADALETKGGAFVASLTYFLDFLSIWILFLVTFVALKVLTRVISRVKVRFRKPLEMAGGYAVSAVVGWVMVCFVTASLHTAPLPKTAFGGGFDPNRRMVFGLAPDIKWLAFTNATSSRALSNGAGDANAFDRDGLFIPYYNSRRAALEAEPGLRVAP